MPEISGLEYIDLCAVSWRCCRLWDLGQQRCVHSYAVHTDSVWTLASAPSFSHVYSGGKDLSVRERLHYLFTICVTMYLIWTPGTMHKTTIAILMCLVVSTVSRHFLCIESCLLLNLLNTISYIVVCCLCVLNAKKTNGAICRCMWQIWLHGRAHCCVQSSNQYFGWHCREMSGCGWPLQTQHSTNGHLRNELLSRLFKGLAHLLLAPFHSHVRVHAWTALHLWVTLYSLLFFQSLSWHYTIWQNYILLYWGFVVLEFSFFSDGQS